MRFITVLFFCSLFFIGIYTFINGFFLTRLEIEKKNECKNITTEGVVCPTCKKIFKKEKKIIWFIIDALRFDFLLNESKIYQGHFPYLFELLEKKNSKLFKFISDAPTTTSQRLKGLLCGNLPTFLDAGKNFDSDLLQSDNLIHQLKIHNKSTVILGDDTWGNLFNSTYFTRSRLFPAFNVKDLDSVDNGILRYLNSELIGNEKEIEKKYKLDQEFGKSFNFQKFDFLVLHFLGVDHAGHAFGIYHQRMYEKLKQMDKVLETIVNKMDNDTILMVFGDHGMTDDGNHGGESNLEIESALFVYSPLMEFNKSKNIEEIPQIDIVPTISLLFGIPIPFGNLGKLIPDFFEIEKLKSLYFINLYQILSYFKEYSTFDVNFEKKEKNFNKIFGTFLFSFLMLKGPEFSFSFLFFSVQMISFLNILKSKKIENFANTFIWILIIRQYYFSFGQQNTFNTINWNAGFVGIDEANNLSGVLVMLNIFAPQILMSFIFPLISNCYNYFLLINGILLFFNMIFTMILRRHLMIWAIFAPKFIFETLGFLISSIFLLFGILLRDENLS
eukprot:gene4179-7489_t